MKNHKKSTFITYLIIAITALLLVVNFLDYQVDQNKSFVDSLENTIKLRVGVARNYLQMRISQHEIILENVAVEYGSEGVLPNDLGLGEIEIVEYSDLDLSYKARLTNKTSHFTTETYALVFLVPIYDGPIIDKVLINKLENLNPLLDQFITSEEDQMFYVNMAGDYIFNGIIGYNINDDFESIEVIGKDIDNILEYMRSSSSGIIRLSINSEYYFTYENLGEMFIIMLTDSTKADLDNQNTINIVYNFTAKTIVILFTFFIYIIIVFIRRHKVIQKSSLQMETLDNLKTGAVALVDPLDNLRFLYFNEAFTNLVGYNKEEIVESFDNCLVNFVHNTDIEEFNNKFQDVITNNVAEIKVRLITKNKGIRWIHFNFSMSSKNDTCTIIMIDINDSKRLNSLIKNLVSTIPGGVMRLDARNFDILYATQSFAKLLGYNHKEFLVSFRNLSSLVHPDDLDKLENSKITSADNLYLEIRLLGFNGSYIWAAVHGKKVIENGEITYHTVIMNISEQIKTLEDLRKETERTKTVLEMTDEFILEYFIDQDRLVSTKKCVEVFGFPIIIENFFKNIGSMNKIHQEDISVLAEVVGDLNNIKPEYAADIRLKDISGNYRWYNLKCVTLYENKEPYKLLSKLTDINEQRKRIDNLLDISQRDSLTGLFNHNSYARKVDDYFRNEGNKTTSMLIIFDLDDFKQVNDTFGHQVGDKVIVEYSKRLKSYFKNYSIVGRIGGDEFSALIKDIGDNAIKTIEELRTLLSEPIDIGQDSLAVTTSYGVAFYPDDGIVYEEVFANADTACYFSKNNGKNLYSLYDESMSIDNTDMKNITFKTSKVDEILYNAITTISKKNDIHDLTVEIFTNLCYYFDFHFSYLFEGNKANFQCTMSFDLEAQKLFEGLIDVHNPTSISLYSRLSKDSILYINDISILKDEMPDLYKTMDRDNTKSVIIVGLYEDGLLEGFTCFGSKHLLSYPTRQEITILITTMRLLFNHIKKTRLSKNTDTESELFKAISNNQELLAYSISKDYNILYASKNMENKHPELILGSKCYFSLYGLNHPCDNCPMKFLGNKNSFSTYQYIDDEKKWIGVTAARIGDKSDSNSLIYQFNMTDYIEKVSYRDKLTGLFNLGKFVIIANNLIQNRNFKYALISSKIIDMSYMYESHGNEVVERLLVEISRVIHSEVKEDEVCCRDTADKFLLLVRFENHKDLIKRLIKLRRKLLAVFGECLGRENSSFEAGIYVLQGNENEIYEAINKADIARHYNSSNKAEFYSKDLIKSFERQKYIERHMETALKRKEFHVFVQPKYDLLDKKPIGYEVFTRWELKKELITPLEYIPIFEKNGFIDEFNNYVFEETFKMMKKWKKENKDVLPFAFNISHASLIEPGFLNKIISYSKYYDISPNLIEIEMQEAYFKENKNKTISILNDIRAAGFKVVIDDFGSGYSSLLMLKSLPVDMLKLDKEFLKDGSVSAKDLIIIENIINMGNSLGVEVLCEGIENATQLRKIKKVGCKFGQGYYFAKPMYIKDFDKKFLVNK